MATMQNMQFLQAVPMAQIQGGQAPMGAFAQPMGNGSFAVPMVAPQQMQATAIPFQPGMTAFLPRTMMGPQPAAGMGGEEKFMIMAMPMQQGQWNGNNQMQWQQQPQQGATGAWDARQGHQAQQQQRPQQQGHGGNNGRNRNNRHRQNSWNGGGGNGGGHGGHGAHGAHGAHGHGGHNGWHNAWQPWPQPQWGWGGNDYMMHRQSNAAMDNDWRRRDSPAPVPPVQTAQLTDTEPMHPGLQPMASQDNNQGGCVDIYISRKANASSLARGREGTAANDAAASMAKAKALVGREVFYFSHRGWMKARVQSVVDALHVKLNKKSHARVAMCRVAHLIEGEQWKKGDLQPGDVVRLTNDRKICIWSVLTKEDSDVIEEVRDVKENRYRAKDVVAIKRGFDVPLEETTEDLGTPQEVTPTPPEKTSEEKGSEAAEDEDEAEANEEEEEDEEKGSEAAEDDDVQEAEAEEEEEDEEKGSEAAEDDDVQEAEAEAEEEDEDEEKGSEAAEGDDVQEAEAEAEEEDEDEEKGSEAAEDEDEAEEAAEEEDEDEEKGSEAAEDEDEAEEAEAEAEEEETASPPVPQEIPKEEKKEEKKEEVKRKPALDPNSVPPWLRNQIRRR